MRTHLFLLLLLLTACAAPPPMPTTNNHQPTTLNHPTPTLTSTPTETPTPTPEPITLTGTFGLPQEIAEKFAGAERYITREPDGTYLVTAFYRDAQGNLQSARLILLPETFSANLELASKNPLAPLTVKALAPVSFLDALLPPTATPTLQQPTTTNQQPTPPTFSHPEIASPYLDLTATPTATALFLETPSPEAQPAQNLQEFTLLWNEKTAEFRLAYQFPALFEGIGTKNPRLIKENLDQIPFIPIEDIQSGLAAQSVLLAMQEDGYQPFGEEVVKWYKELGGSSLLFVQNPDGSKIVWLKPKANDKGLKNNYFNSAEMFTPYWFRTKIGDQIYDIASIAWFDPLDAQNPKTDEFKILFGIPFTTYPMSAEEMIRAYGTRQTLLPMWFQIYGENLNPNDPKQSLLAQLLSIEGNYIGKVPFPAYEQKWNFEDFWPEGFNGIENSSLKVYERIIGEVYPDKIIYSSLPPQLQQMLFPFEVGVAQ